MAGVEDRSGGALPNTGGARPGAGRKPYVVTNQPPALLTDDPKVFLVALMRDTNMDMRLRIGAAVALLPYTHRKAQTGKKCEIDEAASVAANGRFKATEAPVLKRPDSIWGSKRPLRPA